MPILSSPFNYLAAALPLLTVIGLMIFKRWSGQRAGPAGLLIGVIVGTLAFGLNFEVLWVSALKGIMLALFVLAVLIPALLLYHLVTRSGGISALARWLEALIMDQHLMLIVIAWAFSGMLEGLAGFGLPIAIAAPMLVNFGVPPLNAVAAVAVGHSWAITFGDMGVIYQTLTAVTGLDGAVLAPYAALFLGAACVGCGFGAMHLLGFTHKWPTVFGLSLLMGTVQYLLAGANLTSIAALGAGAVGIIGAVLISRLRSGRSPEVPLNRPLIAALAVYGGLTLMMALVILIPPLYQSLNKLVWQIPVPALTTQTGFVTPAGATQAIRPLTHPGSLILIVFGISYWGFRRARLIEPGTWRPILSTTRRSAVPAAISISAMICLSMVMEHTGMTLLLAQGFSAALGAIFPVVSPLVGILGAFATGSNNNSNVLFAPLQMNIAGLLQVMPMILVGAQTAGGALGSMIAPAKLVIGCTTVGLDQRDGEVLRQTIIYALLIGVGVGALTLLLCLR